MTPLYSLIVENNSSALQNIVVFAEVDFIISPRETSYSVIMFAQQIDTTNHYKYSWSPNWGIGWNISKSPLNVGAQFIAGQYPPVSVTPDLGTDNGINLNYDGDFKASAAQFPHLRNGQLQILTSDEFTTLESENLSVTLYISGIPVIVRYGLPNQQYVFLSDDIDVKYYVAATYAETGAVIDAKVLKQKYQIPFTKQNNSISYGAFCKINNRDEFICEKNTKTPNNTNIPNKPNATEDSENLAVEIFFGVFSAILLGYVLYNKCYKNKNHEVEAELQIADEAQIADEVRIAGEVQIEITSV
jgi:hypothetical protein